MKLEIPVFVGGAAVDEHFAADIGAYYGADAMSSVKLALKLTAKNDDAPEPGETEQWNR